MPGLVPSVPPHRGTWSVSCPKPAHEKRWEQWRDPLPRCRWNAPSGEEVARQLLRQPPSPPPRNRKCPRNGWLLCRRFSLGVHGASHVRFKTIAKRRYFLQYKQKLTQEITLALFHGFECSRSLRGRQPIERRQMQ